MKRKILISVILFLTFVFNAKSQDSIVSAFGLDNGLPGIMCNQRSQLDGMPVNFIFPLDASSFIGN